jgi:hypothetical protein
VLFKLRLGRAALARLLPESFPADAVLARVADAAPERRRRFAADHALFPFFRHRRLFYLNGINFQLFFG